MEIKMIKFPKHKVVWVAPLYPFSPLLVALGVPDPDSQAHGTEELPGEEPGGSGDTGLHVHHLLRQDRHPHPEPYDGGPPLVRQEGVCSWHQWRSNWWLVVLVGQEWKDLGDMMSELKE